MHRDAAADRALECPVCVVCDVHHMALLDLDPVIPRFEMLIGENSIPPNGVRIGTPLHDGDREGDNWSSAFKVSAELRSLFGEA